jgi:hypothetical protein
MKTVRNLVVFLFMAGCVSTPVPHPVAMRQPNDAQLSCQDIAIEYKSNTEVATDKIRRNNSADTHDIIVGFFVWPGLADFNNADGHEGNALLDRNIYLRELAQTKKCEGMEFWPAQPERYTTIKPSRIAATLKTQSTLSF